MSWEILSNKMDSKQLLLEESLFFTGNGYLGVRGNLEEDDSHIPRSIRGTYINGFYDDISMAYEEKMPGFPETQQRIVNIMDPQSIVIWVDNEKFSLHSGKVLHYERAFDMKTGCHKRIVHWRSPKGIELKITMERISSFEYQNIFEQYITLESSSGSIPITVESMINGNVTNFTNPNDPRVATNNEQKLLITNMAAENNEIYIEMKTAISHLSIAALSTITVNQNDVTYTDSIDEKLSKITVTFTLNSQVSLHKRTIFADSIRDENIEQKVYRIKDAVMNLSYHHIARCQKNYLQNFWQHTDITITGDTKLQEALRFNLFHILQSTGQDGITNIAAKGLSGEGYEGHYFWDTEIYLLPIFTSTNPELAKKLLLYRYSILPHAKARALELGHKQGALFPWRTISGKECSSFFPAGTAQYHMSADIAHSYIQYYLATADMEFMKEAGVEVLIETARLWIDVGHFSQGNFYIDAVTGPDEYTCIVNNNYYTNVMAKQNLEWGYKAWNLLSHYDTVASKELQKRLDISQNELDSFSLAAEQMYLPVDETLQINPQDDSFLQKAVWDFKQTPINHYPLLLHYHPLTLYRYQVCKQADTVLAHLLIEDEQSEDVIKNSYDYYEKVTTHDSSLSTCIFSIMAARVGNMDKAYDYFMESVRLDLDDTQGNTTDGLHLANMGGTWMAIVVGFAGMRIKESGIMFRPQLPKLWTNYSFRFFYLGNLLQMTITKTTNEIELVEGTAVDIFIHNIKYKVEDKVIVHIT